MCYPLWVAVTQPMYSILCCIALNTFDLSSDADTVWSLPNQGPSFNYTLHFRIMIAKELLN